MYTMYPSAGCDGETDEGGHSTKASFGDTGVTAGIPGDTGAAKPSEARDVVYIHVQ